MQALLIVPLAEFAISLNGFAQRCYHFQVAEGPFIYGSDRIVNEIGGDEQRKREYLSIVFCVFLQTISALGVKEEDIVILGSIEGGLRPHPYALCAAGDRRIDLELNYQDSLLLFQSVATVCSEDSSCQSSSFLLGLQNPLAGCIAR